MQIGLQDVRYNDLSTSLSLGDSPSPLPIPFTYNLVLPTYYSRRPPC